MKSFILEKVCPITVILYDIEEKRISPIQAEISFTITTLADMSTPESMIEAQLNQNISYAKVVAFIEGMLKESIFLEWSPELSNTDSIINICNNNPVVFPNLDEATICAALHSKLNAITHEDTAVDIITYHDIDSNCKFRYVQDNDEDYNLPTQDEWLGEFPYWPKPWWERNDISTMDNSADSQESLDKWLEVFEEEGVDETNTETFREIEEEVTSLFNEANGIKKLEGTLIEVDFTNKTSKFKPTLVDK